MRRLIQAVLSRSGLARDLVFVGMAAVGHLPSASLRHAFYRIVLGVRLGPGARINGRAEIRPGSIEIGANSIVGHDAVLDGRSGLVIGCSVNLSSEVAIWTLQHDFRDAMFGDTGAPVLIGDRAWLSFRATVLPGVTIGEGAVVAANATVTKDVAPYTIVAGTPAKKIGERPRPLTYVLRTSHHFI